MGQKVAWTSSYLISVDPLVSSTLTDHGNAPRPEMKLLHDWGWILLQETAKYDAMVEDARGITFPKKHSQFTQITSRYMVVLFCGLSGDVFLPSLERTAYEAASSRSSHPVSIGCIRAIIVKGTNILWGLWPGSVAIREERWRLLQMAGPGWMVEWNVGEGLHLLLTFVKSDVTP